MPINTQTDLANQRERAAAPESSWMLAVALLALGGAAINAYVSYQLFERNVYYYLNTIFDTDPDRYTWLLLGHAHLSRRHPLMVLFALPFSSAGAVLGAVFGANFKIWIPLLFGPMISACRTIFLMLGLRQMRCPLWWASLIAVVEIASLSRLIIGSEPESFGISSTLFCGVFYLTARYLMKGAFEAKQWILAGVLLGGVTITNIVPYTLVMWLLLLLTLKPREATWITIRTAGTAAVLMVLLYGGMMLTIKPRILQRPADAPTGVNAPQAVPDAAAGPNATGAAPAGVQIDALDWLVFQPGRIVKETPLLNTYAFTGPVPEVAPAGVFGSIFPEHHVPTLEILMPEEYGIGWLIPLALVSLMLVLGTAGWIGDSKGRIVALASLTVIAFQLSLHTIWGNGQLYLYVMHWQISLVILMSGGWLLRGKWRGAAVAVCVLLIGAEIILNFRNLNFILATLDRA